MARRVEESSRQIVEIFRWVVGNEVPPCSGAPPNRILRRPDGELASSYLHVNVNETPGKTKLLKVSNMPAEKMVKGGKTGSFAGRSSSGTNVPKAGRKADLMTLALSNDQRERRTSDAIVTGLRQRAGNQNVIRNAANRGEHFFTPPLTTSC